MEYYHLISGWRIILEEQTKIKSKKEMKMKSIYAQCIMVMGLVFFSCSDYNQDVDHNTSLTSINEVICSMPDVIMDVNYKDSLGESGSHLNKGRVVHFEWDQVKTSDFSKIFYEIQFFNINEEKTPFYSYKTTWNQTDNFADITEFEMNGIAESGGVKQNTEVTLKWRVRASNGINEIFSPFYNMKIKRPDGFARYPSELYYVGSAVEGIKDTVFYAPKLKNLKTMHQVGSNKEYRDNGEYNVFTYLGDGDLYLIEKLSGDSIYRRFTISENNDLIEVLANEQPIKPVKKGAMHRIHVNFKTGKAKIVAIDNLELWYNGSVNGSLGSFSLEDPKTPVWTLTHYMELSGTAISKYRYKFRTLETDHSGNSDYQYWGYETTTAVNQTPNSPVNYFYLYPADGSTNNCFKFQDNGHDKKNLRFTVDLRVSTDYYTHSIKEIKTN